MGKRKQPIPKSKPSPLDAIFALELWVFRFWDPIYHQNQTLDCTATNRVAALRSAQRYLRRVNENRTRVFGQAAVSMNLFVPVPLYPTSMERG